MMKDFKLLLSAGLLLIFLPLMLMELYFTIWKDNANGVIPEKGRRNEYANKMLMNCKVLRFCLRVFHTNVETDEIIREHAAR